MNVGDTCIVSGNVSSSGSQIASVTAGVYTNANGSGCVNGIQATKTVNSYYYYLSNIDSAIHFERIPSGGTYYFVVTAKLQNGTTKSAYKQFTVNGKTCSTPKVTFSDVIGGKTLSISGGSSDTINYTIKKNGSNFVSGTATGSYTTTLNSVGTYSVTAYSSRSGYTKSSSTSGNTTLSQAAAPIITQSITENHIVLNMNSSTSGTTIYYTTSGNTPTISSTKFSGAVSINSEKTIKAIAVKSGYVNSEIATTTVKLEEPAAPEGFTLNGDEKVPVGDNISVKWDSNIMASSYTVTLYKNGEKVDSVTTTGETASFNLSEKGKYELKVYASNFVGNSENCSTTLNVEAMAPLKVDFVDWDGTIIKEQEVPYGYDASLPDDPERKGYTFVSWENKDKITNVKNDLEVKAIYKINTYTVRFYDASGNQVGSTQKVEYGGKAESPEKDLTDIPTGYVFAGWKVIESDNDSKGDYKCIDSNMKLQAVYYWENDELPVVSEITSANWNAETGNYTVKVKLTNYPKQTTTALLRVSLMTSEGKLVKSAKEEIEISADETIEESMILKYSGTATKATAVVLGLKGNDLTGSAYSKLVSKDVTVQSDSVWSDWSEWSTSEATASEDTEVEKKVQYRYADKSTTTSTSPSLSGWEKYDTKTTWNDWGSWSGWSTTSQTASDSKQVETRTTYRYYVFYCPTCGGREPLQGKSDCGKYTLSSSNWVEKWFPTAYKDSKSATYSYATYKRYTTSLGDGLRWNFSSGNLNSTAVGTKDSDSSATVIRKEYRYRTRTQTTTYYYYKWNDWSEWGDNGYTASDSRKVETRTLYRTRKLVPVYSNLAGTEETGKSYSISGKLSSVNVDLNGKVATIMVYKGKNTDPNEDQIQYVSQTTIGEDNAYSFEIIPKTEPTDFTGDYTVCLGLEGSTGLINIDMIEAPKPVYTVKYTDSEGKEISSQEVKAGDSAIVPESPKKDGYIFVGWNMNAVNVQGNMTISAVFAPLQYVVAYVDSANSIISFENYQYGDKLTPPEDPEAEGKEFVGWDCIIDGEDTVKSNMVANAVYKTQTYMVNFVDENDETISSQKIEYGQTATPPAALDVKDRDFLGWSTNKEWWNVKEDMTIKPILIYAETADAPSAYFIQNDDYVAVYLESATENAEIYYTLEDENPTKESTLYDGPIVIDAFDIDAEEDKDNNNILVHLSAKLKAVAVCENMNDSEVQDVVYEADQTIPITKDVVITLDENGGKELDEAVIVNLENEPIGELPIPEYEGYTFVGWFTDKEDGEQVTAESTFSEDTTLYAHWVEDKGDTPSVEDGIHIKTQPLDYTGTVGETASFIIEAEGNGLRYQWQFSSDKGSTWKNSSQNGNKTDTIKVPITEARNGQQYRCVVTDENGNSVTSGAASLIIGKASEGPMITGQPEDYTGAVGDTAVFTVTATGEGLKYQWQYSNDKGATWKNSSQSGNKTATIKVPITEARNGQQYRCMVTDVNGNKVTSDVATLIVGTASEGPVITGQPVNYTGEVGKTATFTVTATGEELKYQWQYSNDKGATWKNSSQSGNKTATIKVPITEARNGQQYRCVVTDANGSSVTSEAAKLIVGTELTITSQPRDYTGEVGETAVFTVEASGESLRYQWQFSNDDGANWRNSSQSGCKTSTISVPITEARNGQKYRCVVTDGNGNSVTSEAGTLIVK
ncbi:InlB B-repeat-containing protein [Anaerostipes sp. 992a]|uniref:InlB B-repeat-containing protein n=1 Tax=Anaerostipes sp. 992a TaxID=1261637 RepID=UPI001FA90FAB|nr:InlB B-repeat-containing protein [Anaerostipes sp. 992a]